MKCKRCNQEGARKDLGYYHPGCFESKLKEERRQETQAYEKKQKEDNERRREEQRAHNANKEAKQSSTNDWWEDALRRAKAKKESEDTAREKEAQKIRDEERARQEAGNNKKQSGAGNRWGYDSYRVNFEDFEFDANAFNTIFENFRRRFYEGSAEQGPNPHYETFTKTKKQELASVQVTVDKKMLRKLMMLSHPDRHGNSEMSTDVTRWLIDINNKLNGD